jgi:hypothetical protein
MLLDDEQVNDICCNALMNFHSKMEEYQHWKGIVRGFEKDGYCYEDFRQQKLIAYENQLLAFGMLKALTEQTISCTQDYRWN